MIINIKKYAQISYIAINKTEEIDIQKGVSDILNYIEILKKIEIKENVTKINTFNLNSRYRSPQELNKTDVLTKKILLENAPLLNKNYFVVPDLIIRKE